MSSTGANHLTCTFSGAGTPLHDDTPACSLSLVSAGSNLHIPARWLAGKSSERIFADFAPVGTHGAFDLYEHANIRIGCARIPVTDATLAQTTRKLYRDLLDTTRRHHLYRIWNYVPHINRWTGEKENYREFCRGRAGAFEDAYHADASRHMPAASAVGCESDSLCVMYVAGRAAPRHHENPRQIPAYLYPPEHGPRPPSFARATSVNENNRALVFISGTASITGHATQHAGDLDGQIACTLDNLRLITETCGASPAIESRDDCDWQRHIKIYLRNAADLPRAQALLAPADGTGFLRANDHVIWLRSDICRASLDIEIEATLIRAL